MYPDPATSPAVMASPVVLPLHIEFEEERLTSDGGLPWLAEAEAAVGVCAALAARLPDRRRRRCRHSLGLCGRRGRRTSSRVIRNDLR